eukprot:NODE_844_length_3753_cov_0.286535.p1 type:complete len:362 gc:universal NODE_844_length_3753_cov_0.286535:3378-2293(-)
MSESLNELKWDTEVQEIHGGQEWNDLSNFVEDFSVTTNFMSTPESGMLAIQSAIKNVSHYPSANQEPAKSDLAKFLKINKNRLLLGNGASEVIDLTIRSAYLRSKNKTCLPGFKTQYKEYERSSKTNGFTIIENGKPDLLCVVNPCNPTGEYKSLSAMKKFILDNLNDNGVAIIDESMQPWIGADFISHSLLSASEWIEELAKSKGIHVYIIHSWTKLWSCTGLRIGSVVCPTGEIANALKKMQVPWSVNCFAMAFLSAVLKDEGYLKSTWELTSELRKATVEKLAKLKPHWKIYGEPFLSWVWVSTGSEDEAKRVVASCREFGVPIRQGSCGYKAMGHVRFAVREQHQLEHVLQALKKIN